MRIINTCIVQRVLDSEKSTIIHCVEDTLRIPLAEVLVRRKRDLHWMNSNEIWDGMQVVTHHDRPFMLAHIQPDEVAKWMSLYQEFDETVGFMKTYFYKFSKQESVFSCVQWIIQEQVAWYALVRDGRFVQLRWPQVEYPSIDVFKVNLTHQWIGWALSFLWWVCLAYGGIAHKDIQDHIHVTVPMIWSITTHHDYILAVIHMLQQHGMYVHIQAQDQSFWQSLQIRITDWEILTIFAHRLEHDIHTVMRKKTYESIKKKVLHWLGKQTLDAAFLDTIEFSVLKLLKK